MLWENGGGVSWVSVLRQWFDGDRGGGGGIKIEQVQMITRNSRVTEEFRKKKLGLCRVKNTRLFFFVCFVDVDVVILPSPSP